MASKIVLNSSLRTSEWTMHNHMEGTNITEYQRGNSNKGTSRQVLSGPDVQSLAGKAELYRFFQPKTESNNTTPVYTDCNKSLSTLGNTETNVGRKLAGQQFNNPGQQHDNQSPSGSSIEMEQDGHARSRHNDLASSRLRDEEEQAKTRIVIASEQQAVVGLANKGNMIVVPDPAKRYRFFQSKADKESQRTTSAEATAATKMEDDKSKKKSKKEIKKGEQLVDVSNWRQQVAIEDQKRSVENLTNLGEDPYTKRQEEKENYIEENGGESTARKRALQRQHQTFPSEDENGIGYPHRKSSENEVTMIDPDQTPKPNVEQLFQTTREAKFHALRTGERLDMAKNRHKLHGGKRSNEKLQAARSEDKLLHAVRAENGQSNNKLSTAQSEDKLNVTAAKIQEGIALGDGDNRERSTRTREDFEKTFGKLVMHELRKISNPQAKVLAMMQIQNTLFHAKFVSNSPRGEDRDRH